MNRRLSLVHCGALTGLALFVCPSVSADEALRKQIHNEFGDRNYMLIEDAGDTRLYLFPDALHPGSVRAIPAAYDATEFRDAFAKTRSTDPRTRVRGLTQLAGNDDPDALDIALTLLTDPSRAVRDEAAHLILDHPDGKAMADALGLIDEDMED